MRDSKFKIQNSKFKIQSVLFVLLILTFMLSGCNKPQQNQVSNIPGNAIGIVNDRKLSLKVYEWKLKSGCEALGINPATSAGNRDFEELREGIVSNLIDSALIVDEAAKRNLVVTPSQIGKAEAEELKTMGGDVPYSDFLKKYNLSNEEYRDILKDNITEQLFLEDLAKDIKITDEEISVYYKEHGNEMNPPDESGKKLTLEQAKPEIINILRTGRGKQMLSDWLKEARKKAKVQLKEEYRFGKLKNEFPN